MKVIGLFCSMLLGVLTVSFLFPRNLCFYVLIEFFVVPGKRLDPVWSHVAQAMYKTNVRFGRVDCTRFPSVATKFKVQSYPTLIL